MRMKTIKNLERLQQLHLLIAKERTGSPGEVSQRIGISERLVFSLIDQLKSLNASVSYDRSRKTYYYCEPFQLRISISVSVVNKDQTTELFDGSYFEKQLNTSPEEQTGNQLLAS